MTHRETYSVQAARFVEACHSLSALRYVTDHGGNLAWRLGDDLLLVTPTMMSKGDVRAEDLVFVTLSGETIEGHRDATSELAVYLALFKARPDIRAIIHSHPPHASGFAITKGKNWLLRPVLAEAVLELGPVPVVPYAEPATRTLADRFPPYLQRYNSFLMENHGVLTMTPGDIGKALMLVDLLELTSISILNALELGDIKEIATEDLRDLETLRQRSCCPLPGVPGVSTSLAELYDPHPAKTTTHGRSARQGGR